MLNYIISKSSEPFYGFLKKMFWATKNHLPHHTPTKDTTIAYKRHENLKNNLYLDSALVY